MPRGRKKKVKLDFNLKPEIVRSILAVVLILLACLMLITFFAPEPTLNNKIQGLVWKAFGYSSILFPVIVFFIGIALVDALKKKIHIYKLLSGLSLGLLLLSSIFHITYSGNESLKMAQEGLGGGFLGYYITSLLISTLSVYGAVVVLLALTILTFIVFTGVSLDQLVGGFGSVFSKFSFSMPNIRLPKKSTTKASDNDLEITSSSSNEIEEDVYNEAASSFRERTQNPFDDSSSYMDDQNDEKPEIEILPTPSEPTNINITKVPIVGTMDTSLVSISTPNLPYSDKVWEAPPLDLLVDAADAPPDSGDTEQRKKIIKETLKSFGISVEVVGVKIGPAVTRYVLEADGGTRIAKITNLSSDLALSLASPTGSVRIEAPIPGTSQIGIEVPNSTRSVVNFRDLLLSEQMKNVKSRIGLALGKDVGGLTKVYDLAKMPHLLVAGTTGSGKSVFLHSVIFSMLFRATPSEVNFIMIDPKRVELVHYNDVPHLITPVVTDIDKAPAIFRWAVAEMDDRYKKFESAKVRNIEAYNEKSGFSALPYIVIIVDELAEIMVVDPAGVEKNIIRLGQLARATGIHLILAVQRPSTDILTGLIKANIPARIAFNVMSQIDSRVIIDQPGAEKLLGKGDMLFIPPDLPKPTRIQGAFIRDKEISNLVNYLKGFGVKPEYREDIFQPTLSAADKAGKSVLAGGEVLDPLYEDAKAEVISTGKASSSYFQRRFSIGYSRAARILDELEKTGVIGPQNGSKPREILVSGSEETGLGRARSGGSGEITTSEFFNPDL